MFECALIQGELFRKLIASVQDLVQDGNFMCDANGISLQGMDSSHVALVALALKKEGFVEYRCDRDVTLGINFANLAKMLKCMGAKDRLSIRAQDEGDSASFVFESEDSSRVSNFELKLMQIDQEQLGVPETQYKAVIRMPSSEFQRICKDLSAIGDTVSISVTKEAVKFSVGGDIGSGDMSLRQSESGDVDGDDSEKVMIELEEPVQQNFALRYLNNFTKATALSKTVTLSLGTDMPLVTEYKMDNLGSIRYYLAPKIDEE
ncbi:hypothetical protein RFI_05259 [Reticulomyxa filosa]|uniref:DNA sliding clamp PCNA n=1 Tax=Reticulomyxa filosa TaxID=46433 RepID=X6P147_RETFI|nr:hypothetical protein RFI_05259 [Reticulomyxa filosa]|eukprot:ETO31853.1 hypothetical protein RFI_05259 [Reticulomyxa filosa]